jgi:hypothetical protein
MKTIKVIYSNGDYTITKANGTREEIEAYYIGNVFNIGVFFDLNKTSLSFKFQT